MAKVRFERDGEVGIVTLADPPLNLVGPELVDDLEKRIEEAESTPLRALLLRVRTSEPCLRIVPRRRRMRFSRESQDC